MAKKLTATSQRINLITSWVVDPKVEGIVRETCFAPFLNIVGRHLKQPHGLLEAICDTFNVETYSFNVLGGSLIFSLEDMLLISGLPINGKPVTGLDYNSSAEARNMCNSTLGLNRDPGDENFVGSKLKFKWLKDAFSVVPAEIEVGSPDLMYYVRAYILAIISTVIDGDKTTSLCDIKYLALITNVQTINEHAWGAAALAILIDSIVQYKKGRNTLQGFSFTLVAFFFIRYPQLANFILYGINSEKSILDVEENEPNFVFPLFCFIFDLCEQKFKDSFNTYDSAFYLPLFNMHEVVWQPYTTLPNNFVPERYREQLSLRTSRTYLIAFNKVTLHLPENSHLQFGQVPFIRPLQALSCAKSKQRSGSNAHDWSTHGAYPAFIAGWEARRDMCIWPDEVQDDGELSGEPEHQQPPEEEAARGGGGEARRGGGS